MTAWQTVAACRGMKPSEWVWIPRKDDDARVHRLMQVCAGCPVKAECLADELAVMRKGVASYGVRGGTTPEQRVALLRRRRRAPNRQPTHPWDRTAPGAALVQALMDMEEAS